MPRISTLHRLLHASFDTNSLCISGLSLYWIFYPYNVLFNLELEKYLPIGMLSKLAIRYHRLMNLNHLHYMNEP